MEMTTIGPLTGADARAYRQPPTAARTVPTAAKKTMKVKRRGRDTSARLFFELLDDLLRLRRFRRRRIGGDDFLERLDRRVFVALVQLHERELEERLAPARIHLGRLLVPAGGFVCGALRELHLAEVVEHLARRLRTLRRLGERFLGRLEVALLHVRHADADDGLFVG